MFEVGDKVRNKITGDALTFMGYSDNSGTRYAKCRLEGLDCEMKEFNCYTYWEVENCELSSCIKPINCEDAIYATEEDADPSGRVLACYPNGQRQIVAWNWIGFQNNGSSDSTGWTRTNYWEPRKPLLECCGICSHNECEDRTYGSDVCWKYRKFKPKPFYMNENIPCHLHGESNV